MTQATRYPSCCSAMAMIDFGQNFDRSTVESKADIIKTINSNIENLKRANHYTVITAIIIRKQKNAKKALEECGFIPASGWMVKPEVAAFDSEAYRKQTKKAWARNISRIDGYVANGTWSKEYAEHAKKMAYSDKRLDELVAQKILEDKEFQEQNYQRATMLFYLPLNGEETDDSSK